MNKRILIDGAFPGQCRVALVGQNNIIEDIEYQPSNITCIKGNIYLAKVVRVEPGLQAAFIDYGSGKNGFLPFSEIHPGYYNIPISDTQKYNSNLTNLHEISAPSSSLEEGQAEIDDEIDIKNHDKPEGEDDYDIHASEEDDDISHSHIENDEIDLLQEEAREPLAIYKQYQIQEVIKKGQILLVQALKEERGNKGAAFSSYISLAGKYCVLMPNNPKNHGISKRIESSDERRRLKYLVSQLMSEDDMKVASVIVRTAGMRRPSGEIKRDYEYLVNLWNRVRENTLHSIAPSLIHVEDGIIQKAIRDMYDSTVTEIIVEGEEACDSAIDFMTHLLPKDVQKIVRYNDKAPIFTKHGIETQIASLYQQSVSLPSGGYIIINPTEALTSIDVNSGKSISERTIEETAVKTNLEAAKEIARQLKIRDISGLIVIDFIDMYENRNRRQVERCLREVVAKDKAKIQLGQISSFGLLEMSRQRLRPSFLESHTKMCSHCNGKGIVRDDEANSMVILRTLENEIFESEADIINVFAPQNITLYILNHKRMDIDLIEDKYGVKINFQIDLDATSDSFAIEKVALNPYEPIPFGNEYIDQEEVQEKQERSKKDHFEKKPKKNPKKDEKKPNKPLDKHSDKPSEDEESKVVETEVDGEIKAPKHNKPARSAPKKPAQAKRKNWKNPEKTFENARENEVTSAENVSEGPGFEEQGREGKSETNSENLSQPRPKKRPNQRRRRPREKESRQFVEGDVAS
ncbi:MAG: Rne/Rng family ribonuclease [Rickettsiaceae bacterium]|nr:Rne/Rng family ribonuclease [Rickettsiaceae bacterium]